MRRFLPYLWPLLAAPAVVLAADVAPAAPASTPSRSSAPTQPDEVDKAAIQELRALIAQKIQDPQASGTGSLGLSTLLTLEVQTGITRFSDQKVSASRHRGADAEADDHAGICGFAGVAFQLPTRRPDGVSEDEWKALHASGLLTDLQDSGKDRMDEVHCGFKNDYTLVDLDSDGRRDLIVGYDPGFGAAGGRYGLIDALVAFQRKGSVFTGKGLGREGGAVHKDDDGKRGESLVSLDRSGVFKDDSYYLISLHGRTYIAYLLQSALMDAMMLIRPFTPFEKGWRERDEHKDLALGVAYQLISSDLVVGNPKTTPALRAALTTAVRAALQPAAHGGKKRTSTCPTSGPEYSDAGILPREGAESIAPVAIHLKGGCYDGVIVVDAGKALDGQDDLNASVVMSSLPDGYGAAPNKAPDLVFKISGLSRRATKVTLVP